MKCSLGISNFFEEISSFSHSVLFLYFFALITEEGFLISSCCSLETYIFLDAYIFPFLLCFSPLFFSQLFVRPPQTTILLFCISFPWGWSWSLFPVQCQWREQLRRHSSVFNQNVSVGLAGSQNLHSNWVRMWTSSFECHCVPQVIYCVMSFM